MEEEDTKTAYLKICGCSTPTSANGAKFPAKKTPHIQNLELVTLCSFTTKVYIYMEDGTTFKDSTQLLNTLLKPKNGNLLI